MFSIRGWFAKQFHAVFTDHTLQRGYRFLCKNAGIKWHTLISLIRTKT